MGTVLTHWTNGIRDRIRGEDMPRHARLDSPGPLHHVMVSKERRDAVSLKDKPSRWESGLASRGAGPTGKSRSAEY